MSKLTRYQQYRAKIKPGDLISFAKHPSLISKIIAWRTGSKHTHSAIVIDLLEITGQRLIVIESLEGGPVPRYLSKRVTDYEGEIWHFPLKFVAQAQRDKAVQFTWEQSLTGIKYDYLSIVRQILRKVSTDASKLFCSELVQMAWEYAGIIDPKIKKALNPGELVNLDFLGPAVRLN